MEDVYKRQIVAIANNHISGREIGAPLTNVALKILMDKSYETQDYRLHYCGLSAEGKTLRSSTMFIKHNSKLVGMLCINFDDSRYLAASENVLRLCHPDIFIDDHIAPQQAEPGDPFPRACLLYTSGVVPDSFLLFPLLLFSTRSRVQ